MADPCNRHFRSSIRWIPAALVVLSTIAIQACGPFAREEKPRHLVMVVFDTLRADRMAVYGYPLETTPFLSSVADEMLRFEDVKAPAPWTVPSHSTLFTGLWPSLHRAQWGSMKLREEFTTLAELLGDQGFCTVGVSANLLVSKSTGLDQGFETFELVRGPWKEKSAEILARLPGYLEEVERRGCRLFLFVNFMDAHVPYTSGRHAAAFGLDGQAPVRNAKTKWEVSAGVTELDETALRRHGAAYDAAVRYVDDLAGDLYALLAGANLLDDSLLLMTSDHGDGLGTHPELGHSISVWEEQLSVPLIVRFPEGAGAGSVERTTSLIGVTPSVLDWLGVERPEHLSGAADLMTAAERTVVADYRSYFSESNRQTNATMAERYPELAARVAHSHVLFCDGRKLIARHDPSPQETKDGKGGTATRFALYDLEADPAEQNDLAPAGGAQFENCVRNYRSLLGQGWYTPFERSSDEPLEEQSLDMEALRSLGYVQ